MVDEKRKNIILQIADLEKEREVCNNQYRGTIDDAQRVRLKRKLDNFDKQINDLYTQLDKQDFTDYEDNNRSYIAVTDKLPQIDFKEQIKFVKNILNEFTEYGAACFLINDSLNMAGDLFSLELQKLLSDDTTDFKHYPVAFSSGGRLDEIGFLQGLGDYLDIVIENQEDYSIILNKFLNFLDNGSIIFIEIKKIDLLNDKEYFLSWLVEIFWKSLTEKLPLACKLRDVEEVRFIILIVDDDIFEEDSSQSFFCQISMITLKEWAEKDIKTWLIKHSGLPKNQIDQMAKSIYQRSRGGTPKLICDALKHKLT